MPRPASSPRLSSSRPPLPPLRSRPLPSPRPRVHLPQPLGLSAPPLLPPPFSHSSLASRTPPSPALPVLSPCLPASPNLALAHPASSQHIVAPADPASAIAPARAPALPPTSTRVSAPTCAHPLAPARPRPRSAPLHAAGSRIQKPAAHAKPTSPRPRKPGPLTRPKPVPSRTFPPPVAPPVAPSSRCVPRLRTTPTPVRTPPAIRAQPRTMAPSRPAGSTLTDGRPLLLPPMLGGAAAAAKSSLPKLGAGKSPSGVHHADTDTPVCYAVKLTNDMLESLLGADSDAFVEFDSEEGGCISIAGREPVKFNTLAIGRDKNDSARAACYSRRGDTLRTVGPILADLEVHQKMNEQISSATKKRTLAATNAGKSREVKVVHEIPQAPTKKQRTRKAPVEKRPRAVAPRAPVRSSSGLPSSALLNSNAKLPNGNASRGFRSAPNASPFTSPVVSPGTTAPRLRSTEPPADHAPRPNGTRRSTPTRSSLANMSVPRGMISPGGNSLTGGFGRGSRGPSRGPSPGPSSINSPSSPKTGNLRPRSEDKVELRRNVIHILALGATTTQVVKSRVLGSDGSLESKERLMSVLHEVGVYQKGLYTLKESLWPEVSESYAAYSEMERMRMKLSRPEFLETGSQKAGGNGGSDGGVAQTQSMTDGQLEAAMESLSAHMSSIEGVKVTSEAEDTELRSTYNKWYPVYCEMISRWEDMSKLFTSLDRRFREARGQSDRDALAKRISSLYERHKPRREKLAALLPKLHNRLKGVRKALDDWALE